MNTEADRQKNEWRRRLRAAVRALAPEQRRAASDRLCRRLLAQPAWQNARNVLLFAPLDDEPDVTPVARTALAQGKLVALPAFDPPANAYAARRVLHWEQGLAPGRFGILEPPPDAPRVELMRLDFVLVPGVGFTPDGHRLGRGHGYYDRLLAAVGGLKCGVGFDEQLVDDIPAEAHDIRLDCVLTPSRWCSGPQGAVMK